MKNGSCVEDDNTTPTDDEERELCWRPQYHTNRGGEGSESVEENDATPAELVRGPPPCTGRNTYPPRVALLPRSPGLGQQACCCYRPETPDVGPQPQVNAREYLK